jgi:hypothetical protein
MEKGILEAILAQLGTIAIANGYHTDVGLRASYSDPYQAEYKGDPKVTFRDLSATSERVNRGYEMLLTVEVEAIFFTTTATRLADGCNILDDLVKCLIHDESWYPEGMIMIARKEHEKDFEGGGKQAGKLTFVVEIKYQEDI